MQYINGLWVDSGSHRFISMNPATGETLWNGHAAGEKEVAQAVSAAKAAFPAWSAKSYEERYAIVDKFKSLIEGRKDELAVLISQETGKVLWDSKSEVAAVLAKLTYASEAYQARTGEKTNQSQVGRAVVRHRPHGVMAVYGPYNFPAHLPNGHIQPALLAGNTIVYKPSELTPMVAEWCVKRWEEAGLPKGVLNLVQGEKETGIALAKENIDGLLFTGSSATGKKLHEQFAGRPEVVLALEMGGNNPLIIYQVEDLKAAVHETLLSSYIGAGQRCTCARRLIVIEWEKAEDFVELLVQSAKQLKIGAYTDTPEPFMGPLISNKEAERIISAQDTLEKLGGKLLLRGKKLKENMPFLSPSVIDVTNVKDLPDEEYFGPILQIIRVSNIEEAIKLANNTKYGLSASIFSDDISVFDRIAPQIRAGLVNFNRQTTGASGAGPFGGIGLSGNHRPAGYYSADYCAYPVASVELDKLALPNVLPPGMIL
ncbi:MAG: succinylglutamate-semialdehyde dehydrogenase [Alphaproteobacteria bacterium]|nr:succinylglutamate-semialdehyde dehydrogenase [Alphaproteobacteria bacterium]